MRHGIPVQATSTDRQRRLAEAALETQKIRTRELEAQLEALRAEYDGLRDRQAAAEHHSFQQVGGVCCYILLRLLLADGWRHC